MTRPIDALQMARDMGIEPSDTAVKALSTTIPSNWLTKYASDILERAAVECEQSEAYRGSVFAQRIRALKPVADKEEK